MSAKCEVRSAGWWGAGILIPAPRTSHFALLALTLAFARPIHAQITADTLLVQTDSARNDSLRRDATDRLLEAEARNGRLVPVMPDFGSGGPRAAGSRLVLDRRAIAWKTAQSVADLLTEIPGVFIWRSGWHGRPMYANYRGRGATSIEWIVDGVPWAPLGPDSVGVDPGAFSLSLVERIEIERWPSGLRVSIYTAQHASLAPRSRVGITTGDDDINRYQGDLEYRWGNGLGLTLAADYFDSPTATGTASDAITTTSLIRAQWVPRADRGVQLQLLRYTPEVSPFVTESDTLGAGLNGERNEMQFRAFGRRGDEASHFQVDLFYFKSKWNGDSVTQENGGGGAGLTLRRPTWRLAGNSWFRERVTPVTLRGEGSILLLGRLALDGEAVSERHDGDRKSHRVGAHASFALPLGFEVGGSLRNGSQVMAPMLADDQAQDIGETSIRGAWRSRYLSLEAGTSHTASFRPHLFRGYFKIDSLQPLAANDWLDLGATFTPLPWLKLEGWFSDPQGGGIDGQPPTHSVVRGEIRSRFLRKFPSGIFELRVAGEMETWGTGTIGRDTLGAGIRLKGATFVRTGIQMKLAGFQFFWERVNSQATKLTYVPGFAIPNLNQTFGMRWEFSN